MYLLQEILVHIFQFLSASDQRAASLTCTDWYNAASTYLMNNVVKFEDIILTDKDRCPLRIFTNSTTKYRKYLFEKVKITTETMYFWDVVGVNITCLTLKDCDVTADMLVYILQSVPNVQELNNISKGEINVPLRFLDEKICLDKLKVLRDIGDPGYTKRTIAELFNMCFMAPALKELHICRTPRFYYRLAIEGFSEVPLFDHALVLITSSAKTLKTFVYSALVITDENLEKLLVVKKLMLQCLHIHIGFAESVKLSVQALSNHQTSSSSLRKLDLIGDLGLTDKDLAQICKTLVTLECLNIQENWAVTNVGFTHLKQLKLLKSLNMQGCVMITKFGLEHGICSEFNETLKELNISNTRLCDDSITLLSERLSLRFLNVTSCKGINDTSIKSIFKTQIHLHTLIMRYTGVSDAGLMDPLFPITNLKCLRELDMRDNRKITEVTLSAFNFKDLCRLHISGCNVAPSGMQGLVTGCRNIEYLNLPKMYKWKEKIVVRMIDKGLPRLNELELYGTIYQGIPNVGLRLTSKVGWGYRIE